MNNPALKKASKKAKETKHFLGKPEINKNIQKIFLKFLKGRKK